MAESSSRVPLVRCPKCGDLLPELPPYSVYRCGGCGALSRAEKKSSIDDGLMSERSWEDRVVEVSDAGFGRGRSGYGEGIRKSTVRGSGFDAESGSSGRSMDGDARKSVAVGSVRGGVRRSLPGELDEPRSVERDGPGYEEFEAREKVGAWFQNVGEEVEYAQKGSEYDDMYHRRSVGHDDWAREGDYRLPRGPRELRDEDAYGGVYETNRASTNVPRRFAVHPDDHGYDQPRYSHESFGGSSGYRNVEEMNRAELIRQYNEVRKRLSMTGDLMENPTRRGLQSLSTTELYGGLDDYVHDDLVRSGSSVESVGARMRPYEMSYNQVHGPFANDPYLDDINTFPPSRLSANEFPQRRPQYYHQRSGHEYIPRHSMDDAAYDPAGISPPNLRTRVQAPPAVGYRRHHDSRNDDFRDSYGQHAPGPRSSSHSQRSLDGKSDGGGSAQAVALKKNQLLCHPISGAAPLVICYNCSGLLRIPKKLSAANKTQFRLLCGACRATLSFNFEKKKSSIQLQPKSNLTNVHDVPSKTDEPDLAGSPVGATSGESYDFGKAGYTFPSTDSELSMKLDAEKRLGQYPSTNDVPNDDLHLDNAINNMPPPLQETDHVAAKQLDESETNASGHDVDARTELVLDSGEIPIGDMSLSSAEASNKHDGGDKKGPSSGVIGRGVQDSSPPINSSNPKCDVFVNGQPLPHRVVRKAEKLAGPVSPGNYWYDSRAGFWGVMGSYCLGIIPPFIQEFGFPMPADCSSGDTGIHVNGRELHAKDLDLLASRRLPRTRNKWYVIDISGKVLDEESGDTVVNLGKLAPSVEKAKHGFGMHSPEL